MKKIILASLCVPLVILFVLLFARPAFAHSSDPRLEISAEKLNPGAQLDIRGVDFEIEKEVKLSLIGSQVEIPLGMATADIEGTFLFSLTLPIDLKEGTYIVRATTEDHVVESPQLTVSGAPLMENGGQERLDEETGYGLLAPMPTPVRGVAASVSQTPTAPEPAQMRGRSFPIVWVASGVGLLVLLALLVRLRK